MEGDLPEPRVSIELGEELTSFGTSEVIVKQEIGNEDEESFMSRITIKNEPGTSEVLVKQEKAYKYKNPVSSSLTVLTVFCIYVLISYFSMDYCLQLKAFNQSINQSINRDDNQIKNEITNSSVPVAEVMPFKTEYEEDDHNGHSVQGP